MQAQEHAALNRFISQTGARARSRGVTLLELMIVVVILGILGTIAVSTYRGYLLRTNRTEARMALLRVQAAQEKFFLQWNRYADTAELTPGPGAKASGRRRARHGLVVAGRGANAAEEEDEGRRREGPGTAAYPPRT